MCLRNLPKNLVHGALIESWNIDLPALPCICSTWPCFWAHGTLPTGVSTPVKWSRNAPMCLRNLQKVFGALGPNRSWDIDLHTLHMHLLNLAQFWCTGTLPAGVSTPAKWSRNAPMCLRNFQKVFGAWGLNRSWDIDLPTSPCICSTWPCYWVTSTLPMGVSTPPKWVYKCFYVSQEPPKSIWYMGL